MRHGNKENIQLRINQSEVIEMDEKKEFILKFQGQDIHLSKGKGYLTNKGFVMLIKNEKETISIKNNDAKIDINSNHTTKAA